MTVVLSNHTHDGSHVPGLDTLRFVAAAWVALFHGARLPLDRLLGHDSTVDTLLISLNNGLFNGVAAVMIFFVISGFVVHRPNVGRSRIPIGSYLARRLLRIVPPAGVIIVIATALGSAYRDALDGVLWSLYCEIAYYILYPVFLGLFDRGRGWVLHWVLMAVALGLIALTWPAAYFWQLPIPIMAAIGLPSWILGCLLAEAHERGHVIRAPGATIWLWRLGAVALACALKVPVTHGSITIGYPASHWLMALYAYFWLDRELDRFCRKPPPAWCEMAGRASYSLYLVHVLVLTAFGLDHVASAPFAAYLGPHAAWMAVWAVQLVVLAASVTVFYLTVELTSHRLARWVGAQLKLHATRPVEPDRCPLKSV